MKDFRQGVRFYTHGTVDISFPEDDICCRWCPLMGVEIKTDRSYCRKTGEYLQAPDLYTGFHCPVIIEPEKED